MEDEEILPPILDGETDGEATSSAGGAFMSTRIKASKDPLVMPNWMKHPTLIGDDSIPLSSFAQDHKLHDKLVANIKGMGIQSVFSVQVAVIPALLQGVERGGDSLVRAPTGSGKTLAYAIPIVQVGLHLSSISSSSHHLLRPSGLASCAVFEPSLSFLPATWLIRFKLSSASLWLEPIFVLPPSMVTSRFELNRGC